MKDLGFNTFLKALDYASSLLTRDTLDSQYDSRLHVCHGDSYH